MQKQRTTFGGIPTFTSEQEEADWWSSAPGRKFLKAQSASRQQNPAGVAKLATGSRLVAKLGKAKSVQIALRLPSPDLAKAREIAERKGIGYQTLLKMILHEGLQRAARQTP